MAKLTKLEKKLLDALKMAHKHLEYCNYGDAWERECAEAAKLSEKIEEAVKEAEEN